MRDRGVRGVCGDDAHRPYIDGITVVEALAELHRCAGTQFHPEVVDVFHEVFRELFQ
ncbi:MAG TPA: hypothetical protein VK790_03030 [Solirubrobacteraceae bacterium]|nr:hypothetical protein [Solirubrobacteraceae bacterium]